MANVEEMKWSKLYDLLLAKAVRKGRTEEEVDKVISWLTGYKGAKLRAVCESDITYAEFFRKAPALNPCRSLITGKVCGVQVETIEDPFMKQVRQMDKLIDELAKGKKMEKILRAPSDIDEFIGMYDEDEAPTLSQTCDIIREVMSASENVQEKITWGMPTWWKGDNLIHVAPAKKHLGIYPGSGAVEYFADRLTEEGYKFSKGAIQFPYKRELDVELIREIAQWTLENNAK